MRSRFHVMRFEEGQGRRRFRVAGLLWPLLYMFLHYSVQFAVSLAYAAAQLGRKLAEKGDLGEAVQVLVSEGVLVSILISSILSIVLYYFLDMWRSHALASQTRAFVPADSVGPADSAGTTDSLSPVPAISPEPAERAREGTGSFRRPLLQGLRNTLFTLAIAMACVLVCNFLVYLIQLLATGSPWVALYLRRYVEKAALMTTGSRPLLQILTLALFVPVAEELLFRQLILRELKSTFNDGTAILLCALFFALFHLDPIQIAYVFPAGLALAAVRTWTNSLGLAIFCHAAFNFFGGNIQLLMPSSSVWETLYTILLSVAVPCALYGLYVFRRNYLVSLRRRTETEVKGAQP